MQSRLTTLFTVVPALVGAAEPTLFEVLVHGARGRPLTDGDPQPWGRSQVSLLQELGVDFSIPRQFDLNAGAPCYTGAPRSAVMTVGVKF